MKTQELQDMWKIPLFDIRLDQAAINAVQEVMRSGWLTMGEVTKNFESLFAEFLNIKYAIAVSNGTAALHLANMALDIRDGDEVICPSLTFVAGANSIVYVGGQPVFADIAGYDQLNISPQDIKAKITSRTKAVQVVHYAGHPCDMGPIKKIADEYRLYIIEDCAHAPGAEYNGKLCGTIGDVGCFSFFTNKNMTTAEGGMVVTNNDQLANTVRLMRSHGMTTLTMDRYRGQTLSYDVVELGFNYRMDEMRAALGVVQLNNLNDVNNKRYRFTQLYKDRLSHISGLTIPFRDSGSASACHIFPVILDENINREKFIAYLKHRGIQTSIHYPPAHLFDFYKRTFGFEEGILPLTEAVARRELTLPLYPSMGDDAVQYVCDAIEDYFRKGEKCR